jgi:hypothetical protein
MTAHSAAAESYRGIGVDNDFLDYVFNNTPSSIIISRVANDDDDDDKEGFLCNNDERSNNTMRIQKTTKTASALPQDAGMIQIVAAYHVKDNQVSANIKKTHQRHLQGRRCTPNNNHDCWERSDQDWYNNYYM